MWLRFFCLATKFCLFILGAVIAREYGLPCVVNIASATNIFKSGNYLYQEIIIYLPNALFDQLS